VDVDTDALARRLALRFPGEVVKRGRPKGSRNRKNIPVVSEVRHSDPSTLVERQFVIAEWMQSAFREEIRRRMGEPRLHINSDDVKRFESLTMSLSRAVESLKKVSVMADELASRMSAEQLLDAALKKIEAQDTGFVKYSIKRLKAHLERVLPKAAQIDTETAADALRGLLDE
jgi:hypothetical protein